MAGKWNGKKRQIGEVGRRERKVEPELKIEFKKNGACKFF